MKNVYRIINVFNHNTILCESLNDYKKYIFLGKGIGFGKKTNDRFIYNKDIQTSLQVLDQEDSIKYEKLINSIENKKVIDIVQKVVNDANNYFDNKINNNINITLLDHINFAVERYKNNMIINYPFIEDLKYLYPKEYQFSKNEFIFIKEELKDIAVIDDAEIGFLTLHIHAALTDKHASDLIKKHTIVNACINEIEKLSNIKLDRSSIFFIRLVKHIEFAINRHEKGIYIQNIMIKEIKERCPSEFEITCKVNEMLKRDYDIELTNDELGYLALHIFNLLNS